MNKARCEKCNRAWDVSHLGKDLGNKRCTCGGRLTMATLPARQPAQPVLKCAICRTSIVRGATPATAYRPRFKYDGEQRSAPAGAVCCWRHEPVPIDFVDPLTIHPSKPEYAAAVASMDNLTAWRAGKIASIA